MSPADRDAIVRRVTAFRSWAELAHELREGYVPTLDPRTARPADRAAVEALRALVFRDGYSVHPMRVGR